jgi:hypothetical protein
VQNKRACQASGPQSLPLVNGPDAVQNSLVAAEGEAVVKDRDSIEEIMQPLQLTEAETLSSAPILQETFHKASVAEIPQWHDNFSLSVFVVDVDAKPVFAFAAKKYADAEVIYRDERLRNGLRSLKSDGSYLCDDFAILRLRLARSSERATYRDHAVSTDGGLGIAYLVDLDETSE